ncbi:hypothetical protein MY4824_010024 [Beauveria thailandica]
MTIGNRPIANSFYDCTEKQPVAATAASAPRPGYRPSAVPAGALGVGEFDAVAEYGPGWRNHSE